MVEIHVLILVDERVGILFVRQFYVHPARSAASEISSLVGCLHYSGTSARDDTETHTGKFVCYLFGQFVVFVVRFDTRGSENGYARTYTGHYFKSVDKFAHNAEYRPRVVGLYLIPCLGFEVVSDLLSYFFHFSVVFRFFNTALKPRLSIYFFLFLIRFSAGHAQHRRDGIVVARFLVDGGKIPDFECIFISHYKVYPKRIHPYHPERPAEPESGFGKRICHVAAKHGAVCV